MKLDKSEEEMAGTIAAFKERVVALYKAGHIGTPPDPAGVQQLQRFLPAHRNFWT